jgi:short-subunit dehydrogenase
MAVNLKAVDRQVMVITGASSGMGLATARLAAERGAAVVLSARNGEALEQVAEEIRAAGGVATAVVADVANMEQVQAIADHALREFGRVDTWFNNAGASIYGTIEDTPLAEARRLFDTNYWGVVHGSLVAVELLRRHGGALINMGSMTSDLAMPLLGHYSASKQAVKGFTDSLRLEVEKAELPIAVTLIKPAGIDTPFPDHALNLMEREPKLPPPVYDPDVAARAVLRAAEKPTREVIVGGGARVFTAMNKFAPRLTDKVLEATMFEQQKRDEPARPGRGDSLHSPSGPMYGRARGRHPGHVMGTSLYTVAAQHPLTAIVATAAAVVAVGRGFQRLRS